MTETNHGMALGEPQQEAQSPGLGAGARLGAAFELKFRLNASTAQMIEDWARRKLTPDSHGQDGTYHTTSIYCDTPNLDVFLRSPRYRRSKFRVRRYASECGSETTSTEPFLFLERKSKWGDRVQKKRASIPESELPLLAGPLPTPTWQGGWFLERIQARGLQPTCRVGYRRTAFFGWSGDSPVRLTLDRDLVGAPACGWNLPPLEQGVPLLPDEVLVELKFHIHLPPLFHELMPHLPFQPARVSKYRRCMVLCGLAPTNYLPPSSSTILQEVADAVTQR